MKNSLRPIDVFFINGDVKTVLYSGWFHCWSHEETVVDAFSKKETFAIIETPKGEIVKKAPEEIRFNDRGRHIRKGHRTCDKCGKEVMIGGYEKHVKNGCVT